MSGAPTCPRCRTPVRPPSIWRSGWACDQHGVVTPFYPPLTPSVEVVARFAASSPLPVWLPWPLPRGWVVSGLARAGDDVGGVRASVVACSGPNPVGGGAELLVVCEEPGVGLGARFAGIAGPDPGLGFGVGRAEAKVDVDGHPTAIWLVAGAPDRAAYAGEASSRWLWVVLHPETAGALLVEQLPIADLRLLGHEVELLPYGALCPLLRG